MPRSAVDVFIPTIEKQHMCDPVSTKKIYDNLLTLCFNLRIIFIGETRPLKRGVLKY